MVKVVYMNKAWNKCAGFTLIELMVVIVVVAVLAAIAFPSYETYIARANQSKTQLEMLKISERLENYKGKQLSYAGYIPEHQSLTKGEVNIPYDSASDYKYQIKIVDIDDSTKALEDSTIGQGWKMIAIPNQTRGSALRNSEYLLLDSRGIKCMTKDPLLITSENCGENTQEWK